MASTAAVPKISGAYGIINMARARLKSNVEPVYKARFRSARVEMRSNLEWLGYRCRQYMNEPARCVG